MMKKKKQCPRCNVTQAFSRYGKSSTNKDGLTCWCKSCRSKAAQENYNRTKNDRDHLNRNDRNWSQIQSRYNMSKEEWLSLYEQQNGLCAICKNPDKTNLCVDHCHETEQNRGLLCRSCNLQLGFLEKEVWREKAEAYLADWIRQQ